VIARTTLGRGVSVVLSLVLSQIATPVVQAATPHLLDEGQMATRLAEHEADRAQKVQLVQDMLDTPVAQRQAKIMGVNLDKARVTISHLSDAELKDLSQRAAHVRDVAAGHGDEGLVILAVVLLVVAVLILVAASGPGTYYDDCGCYY